MCKLGSEPIHGPILLGWSMVRHFYLSGGEVHNDMIDADTHKLGNTALQLGVFKILLDILSAEPFSRSNVSVSIFEKSSQLLTKLYILIILYLCSLSETTEDKKICLN